MEFCNIERKPEYSVKGSVSLEVNKDTVILLHGDFILRISLKLHLS
jgi:hypothetical protein